MASPATSPIEPEITTETRNAVSRYQKGYRVARTVSGLGQACKIVGILTGIGALFFSILGSETIMRPNPVMEASINYRTQHNLYLISAILLGILIAFVGWVIGELVSAYSYHLQATLDRAVNTSPFLNNVQRAQLMTSAVERARGA